MANSQHIKGLSNLVLAIHEKQDHAKRMEARRNPSNMKKELFESSQEGLTKQRNEMNKMIEIESNYARDRVVMLDNGKLVLHFNHQGRAQMPEHLLPVLRREMRVRPGRYSIVEREEDTPKSDDAVGQEAADDLQARVDGMLKTLEEEIALGISDTDDDDDDEDDEEEAAESEEPPMEDE